MKSLLYLQIIQAFSENSGIMHKEKLGAIAFKSVQFEIKSKKLE